MSHMAIAKLILAGAIALGLIAAGFKTGVLSAGPTLQETHRNEAVEYLRSVSDLSQKYCRDGETFLETTSAVGLLAGPTRYWCIRTEVIRSIDTE
jgi:hypothetical protein